jgi:formate hydrogenlyase subunit 4
MSILVACAGQLLHLVLVLAAAPVLSGVVEALAAWFAGRAVPSVMQPWHDVVRLFAKAPVRASSASAVTSVAPTLSVVLAVLCAALVPSFMLGLALAPLADPIAIAALLVAMRVVPVLAAMDAGTAEGGIAAAESAQAAVFTETALLLALFVLSLSGGGLDRIVASGMDGSLLTDPSSVLAIAALALAAAEAVVQPAPENAYSARDLGLSRIAGQVRLLVWCDLVGALALPFGMAPTDGAPLDWLVGLAAWGGRLALAVLAVAALRVFAGSRPSPALRRLALAFGVASAGVGLL